MFIGHKKGGNMTSKSNILLKTKSMVSINELLADDWITYDNINFFKRTDNVFQEIKLEEQCFSNDIEINITEKIIKKKNKKKLTIHFILFKNKMIKKECFGVEKNHEVDKNNNIKDSFVFHRDDGYPACIIYDEFGDIDEMKWFYMGNEYTNDIIELIKKYKIKKEDDISKNYLNKIIEINKLT